MTRRRFDRREIDLLPVEEVYRLLPYGRDAIWFGRFMATCMLVAGVIAVLGYLYDAPGAWVRAASAAVGFLVIGVVGEQMKWRRFFRLTAEAIDKHKNGTP